MSDVKKGTVKWFHNKKGYGFIHMDDQDQDIFFHYTGIAGTGYRSLKEGDVVEFEVVEGKKGLKAINIKKINKE